MTRPRLVVAVTALVLLLPVGCASFGSQNTAKLSAEELRERLNALVQGLVNEVSTTADTIMVGTTDRAIKRRALLWKIHTTEVGQDVLLTEPPTAAFLDLWTLAVQMRQYVEQGGGSQLFGADGQPLVITTVQRFESATESLAESLLQTEDLAETRAAVHGFVGENPLVLVRGRVANRPSIKSKSSSSSTFEEVISLPLAPFRAFGGIDNAATAVREFAGVADRFTTIVHSLPEQTTWYLELLLYDIEDRQTVRDVVTSLQAVATSADSFAGTAARLTDVAQGLPEELRTTLLASIDAVGAAQPELQRSLAEARATAEALDRAAHSVETSMAEAVTVSQSLEQTAGSFVAAGVAWEATAHAFGLPGEKAKAGAGTEAEAETETETETEAETEAEAATETETETGTGTEPGTGTAPAPAKGFDVEAYGRSAEKLTEAAVEIRALVEQIDALLASDRLERVEASTASAVGVTSEHAEALVDHLTWRALQVLLAALVALLVYRVAAARLAR